MVPSSLWSFERRGGKLGPIGISGVFRNYKGDVLFLFSNNVGIRDKWSRGASYFGGSSILLQCFLREVDCGVILLMQFHEWTIYTSSSPWKFQFYFNEVKPLVTSV